MEVVDLGVPERDRPAGVHGQDGIIVSCRVSLAEFARCLR